VMLQGLKYLVRIYGSLDGFIDLRFFFFADNFGTGEECLEVFLDGLLDP
jgi:hypothetical protein